MNRFLNLSTRANVSPDLGGVCAHGGLVTGFISDTAEDRANYIARTMTRTGSVPSYHTEFANLKTLIKKSDDFHTYACITNISFDFDMKRKPLEESFSPVWVDIAGKSYHSYAIPQDGCDEINCFDTVPFESIAEYQHYRSIKESSTVLRTADEWKRFFIKVHSPKEAKTRVADASWSALMSCIIAYRNGKVTIEPLDKCTSTKEKLDYINSHNHTGKQFTESHWKNARRPERASQMLPLEVIQDTLLPLQEGYSS